MQYPLKQLTAQDVGLLHNLLDCFAVAFDEQETYCGKRPDDGYLRSLLNSDTFIALVAQDNGAVVGGLSAYELKKFEQQRSEVYIYDLAVAETHRRRGIATALIKKLTEIAAARNAWVVVIQADVDNEEASRLYGKFGTREEMLNFDIPVTKKK